MKEIFILLFVISHFFGFSQVQMMMSDTIDTGGGITDYDDVPDCVVYLDGRDTNGDDIYNDQTGAAPTTWVNKGSLDDFTKVGTVTILDSDNNSQDAISLNQTGHYEYSGNKDDFIFLTQGNEYTIFYIGKSDISGGTVQFLFGNSDDGNDNRGIYVNLRTTGIYSEALRLVSKNGVNRFNCYSIFNGGGTSNHNGSFPNGQYNLFRLETDLDAVSSFDRHTFYAQGNTYNYNIYTENTSSASPTNKLKIGNSGITTNSWKGTVQLILIYTRTLTAQEISDINALILTDFNLTP